LRARAVAIPLGEAIDIAGQVASALSAAQVAGIVYRDVRPENIMLREAGHVKLVEFGLAKIGQEGLAGSTNETVAAGGVDTTPGIVMGTTAYMSPEQARGRPVDARSDILQSGRRALRDGSRPATVSGRNAERRDRSILHFDPPSVAHLPTSNTCCARRSRRIATSAIRPQKISAADRKRLRRRLEPAASTSQDARAWTATPKSGGAAASTAGPLAGTTVSHAEAAPGARTAPFRSGRQ
jgi:serine/threonine protein kinase